MVEITLIFQKPQKVPYYFSLMEDPVFGWSVHQSLETGLQTHRTCSDKTLAFCSLPLEPLDAEGNLRNCD